MRNNENSQKPSNINKAAQLIDEAMFFFNLSLWINNRAGKEMPLLSVSKFILWFGVLFVAVILQSCNRAYETKYYENGKISSKSMVNDEGIYDGDFVEYHPNGNVKSKGKRNNGHLVYIERYYLNGRVEEKSGYINDMIDGKVLLYHKNGNIKLTALYKKGNKDGDYVVYDSLGKVYEIQKYNNEKLIFYKRYSGMNRLLALYPLLIKLKPMIP
jgi:hypothetical protein